IHKSLVIYHERRRRGWSTRWCALLCFLCFCLFVRPSAILLRSLFQEKNSLMFHSIPQTLSPDFTDPETFLEILVGGAAALCGAWRRRRRGKRAGALVRLQERGFRT